MPRLLLCLVCFFGVSVVDAHAQTVTWSLTSPQQGSSVAPGSTIDWSISLEVSNGDNLGLALFVVDLLQDGVNPERVDLVPGVLPASMVNFSRPEGVSNPGPGGVGSGYGGTPFGPVGEADLRQIGGAQNTFGASVAGMGTVTTVTTGLGQSGPLEVASGSFTAPATPGTYSFRLDNARANVVSVLAVAPDHSSVVRATSAALPGTFELEVLADPQFVRGDCNVDGAYNLADAIHVLSHLFSGPLALSCPDACDTNDDGALDLGDAVNLLTNLFEAGAPLPAPNGACGLDPTSDALPCDTFNPCD